MLKDLYLFIALVVLGTVVICTTVYLLDRWLARLDKSRLRRPLRVRKVKKKYEPSAPARHTVYPSGKEVVK